MPRNSSVSGIAISLVAFDGSLQYPMRQANRREIGLIVGPAADWPAITPLHADMAILRAVESGFSLLRPTSSGRSIATATRGRTLAAIDYADDAMVAYVRVVPVRTPYGAIGDSFAWLCLGTFVVLSGLLVLD